MPLYDVECAECGTIREVIAHWRDTAQPCATCGAPTERIWTGRAPAAIDDSLPGGGRYIENLDVRPVYVESKTQLARELRERGLVNRVRHVGAPGSDKSKHTTKWF